MFITTLRSTATRAIAALLVGLGLAASVRAQVSLSSGTYTQTFDAIGGGLPAGWSVYTGATAAALGTPAALTTAKTSWASTGGQWENAAASDNGGAPFTGGESATVQGNATDRALGIRQTGTFGDPGASANFNFSTSGLQVTAISFSAQMLSVQTRSTTWSLQYGIGAVPAAWTTIATYSDPAVFGQSVVTASGFGAALDNQSNVWLRIVALGGSSGSGTRDTFGIDDFTIVATTGGPVLTPPSITAQPTSQTATVGDTVTLGVGASGSAPLSYQWRKGGGALANGGTVSGATTATLTLTGVTAADAGSYDVVVSNGVPPDATSNTVTLTVNNPPPGPVTWNFGTAAGVDTPSGLPADVTGGQLTSGNSNGATTLLSTTSASNTYAGASGAFNAGVAARVGAFGSASGGSAYFEFTLTPDETKQLTIGSIAFGSRSTGTGPQAFAIYTSLDNFAAPVATGALAANSTWALQAPALSPVTAPTGSEITIRIYGYGGSGSPSSGTINWRIDDLKLTLSTIVGPPVPPAVTSVAPANGATGAGIAAPIAVTFNKNVAPGGTWFSLVGGTTGAHTATVSGGPKTFTLTPDAPFAFGETVTLTIFAAQVTDLSTGTLHPAADFTSSYTTLTTTPLAIHTVQGSALASTYAAQTVTLHGIVIASFQGAGQLGGYYLEAPDAEWDGDPATSEGIYVFDNAHSVTPGDFVTVTGTVTEFGTAPNSETELSPVLAFAKQSSGNPLPSATPVTLPFTAAGFAERYEGMLVTFSQTLTVTDNFDLGHFGEVLLSNGRLATPTNVVAPGAPAVAMEAANLLNQVVLDDDTSSTYPSPTPYLDGANPVTATRRTGDTTTGTTGVLANKFGAYVIEPTVAPTFVDANPRQNSPATTGTLRVAFGNVENFMNGDGTGGGFPTSRGATTFDEWQRHLAKVTAGILNLAPDVMGISEMENDGVTAGSPNGAHDSYGATSALAQLVANLNAHAPAGTTYAFVDASAVDIVTDVIHSAFIYRVETVETVGAPAMLDNPYFNNHARNPLAQTFRQKSSGAKLTACVNHFRAKGGASSQDDGTGLNDDQGDGQATNNYIRTKEAQALTAWLATDPTGSGDARVLILGDLNSYAKEDPIAAIENAGYVNLMERFEGVDGYSYAFNGEFGHLDQMLASASLNAQAVSGATWHVNSDEPVYYDYNVENKDASQQAINVGTPFRYSDHDSVVVGLDLWVAPAFAASPASQTATVGADVTLTAAATGNPAPTYQWRKDGAPISGATSATLTLSHVTTADAGSYDVVATNSAGSATSATAVVTVNKATPLLAWAAPAPIVYGTPLGAAQLNATASVAGAFVYSPAAGAVLNAGPAQPLSAAFVPADPANYNSAGLATAITVTPAPATLTLSNLSQVYDGAPKSIGVTIAPSGVAFSVTYEGGTAPTNAGSYHVSAAATDPNYLGSTDGTLVIGPATPLITWAAPAAITYGTPLGAAQLNATASTAGAFFYTPAAGILLPVGTNEALSVAFTPADTANYTTAHGSTAITVNPAGATIALGGLVQSYDGTPKSATVTTTPDGLAVSVTYNGSATPPTNPGAYAVVATINDANYSGSATGTLVIGIAAIVRHAPVLNGDIDGSVQVLLPESTTLNGGAMISGDLLVPGAPNVVLNGHPTYGGTLNGSGAATPTSYTITLNGNAVLRHVVRRTDAIALPAVAAPPAPAGTRNVSINNAGQNAGDFATLRNLTLNGNAGQFAVPPGTYGSFTANGSSGFTLGIVGATQPTIYNFQNLTLNGNSQLQVVGPVIVTFANGVSLNGTAGSSAHPEWLTLNVASGGVTLNGNVTFDGSIVAPGGTITINGNTTLHGTTASDRLTINGNGLLAQP